MSQAPTDVFQSTIPVSSRPLSQDELAFLEELADSAENIRPRNRALGLTFGIIAIMGSLTLLGLGVSLNSQVFALVSSLGLSGVTADIISIVDSVVVLILAGIAFHFSRAYRDNSVQRMIANGTVTEVNGNFEGKDKRKPEIRLDKVRLRCAAPRDVEKIEKLLVAGQNRLVLTGYVKKKDSILLSVNETTTFQKPMRVRLLNIST